MVGRVCSYCGSLEGRSGELEAWDRWDVDWSGSEVSPEMERRPSCDEMDEVRLLVAALQEQLCEQALNVGNRSF